MDASFSAVAQAIAAYLARAPSATDEVDAAVQHLCRSAQQAVPRRGFAAAPGRDHAVILAPAIASGLNHMASAIAVPGRAAGRFALVLSLRTAPGCSRSRRTDRLCRADRSGWTADRAGVPRRLHPDGARHVLSAACPSRDRPLSADLRPRAVGPRQRPSGSCHPASSCCTARTSRTRCARLASHCWRSMGGAATSTRRRFIFERRQNPRRRAPRGRTSVRAAFDACSGVTCVAACRVTRPPGAILVMRLPTSRLPTKPRVSQQVLPTRSSVDACAAGERHG